MRLPLRLLARLPWFIGALCFGLVVLAFASGLTSTSRQLGSGSATPAKCSASTWTLSPVYTAGLMVTGVEIQIPSASSTCTGDTVSVAGVTSTSHATGSGTAPAPGNTLAVSFSACTGGDCTGNNLTATAVTHLYVSVTGA